MNIIWHRGEKREAFHRLLEHHNVEDSLPNCVINGKLFEANKRMFESIKVAYGILVGTRQSLNLTFKNVLLLFLPLPILDKTYSNKKPLSKKMELNRWKPITCRKNWRFAKRQTVVKKEVCWKKITNTITSSFPPKPNQLPPSNNPKPYDTTSWHHPSHICHNRWILKTIQT